jgi:hypothetical protein
MKQITFRVGYVGFAMAIAGISFSQNSHAQQTSKITPLVTSYEAVMVTQPPQSLKADTFYKKFADAGGIPVLSSAKVSDAAVLIARDIINYMVMKRPDVRQQMLKSKAELAIMAYTEMQTDLPGYRDWKKPEKNDQRLTPNERENYDKPGGIASMTDKQYWDNRARGMGGNETSCAEENLLGIPGTKYFGENIMVHEWSHNIMVALERCDPQLIKELELAYQAAKTKGLYKGQYAINTIHEYWAEGTQWWFWSNYEFYDGNTRVQSPDDLKAYDPALYNILSKVYIGHHIPADVYYGKNLSNKIVTK